MEREGGRKIIPVERLKVLGALESPDIMEALIRMPNSILEVLSRGNGPVDKVVEIDPSPATRTTFDF